MTPEQGRNVLNAFLEIREKLADAARQHDELRQVVNAVWWLVLLNIVFQVIWIGVKIWLDIRYERRFRVLTRLAGEHGDDAERQKARTVRARDDMLEAGQEIIRAGGTASTLAAEAARKADAATSEVRAELRDQRRLLMTVVQKLCPDVLGEAADAAPGGKP